MANEVDDLLTAFSTTDYSVRLLRGVCKVVPFGPELTDWYSMVDGLKSIDPDAKKPVLDRAMELTRTKPYQRALWMIGALDTADSGISVFSGVRSAVKLYQARDGSERLDALETDTQQAVDAALKALAMAFVVTTLFDGGPTERVASFRDTEAGKAMIFYFATMEAGLPFMDNALVGGGAMVQNLWERFGPEQQEKLAAVASPEEAQEAVGTLKALIGPLDSMVKTASSSLSAIGDAAVNLLPTAMNVGDKVAGVAATGADLLPVYRFLGARLVAEVALLEALAEAQETAEAVPDAAAAAAMPVKFTRSKDDLPDAPKRKRGCLPFFVMLIAAGAAALGGVIA